MQSLNRISILLLMLVSISVMNAWGWPPANSSDDPSGMFKIDNINYYPGIMEIPVEDFQGTIIPGYAERAQANMELIRIFYGQTNSAEREELLRKFPHWRHIIDNHSGFWPELVGRLDGKSFARLFGPDIWRSVDGLYVVGEENGPNIGGPETLRGLSEKLLQHDEVGEVPHNTDLLQRFIGHIQKLGVEHTGKNPEDLTIVVADEASIQEEAVRVGDDLIEPPFPPGRQIIETMREGYAQVGVTWLSLVDKQDKERIVMKDGVLHLREQDGKLKKVDVFFSLADLESMDPTYKPQMGRNIKAQRADLNKMAKLVGIPGLMDSWLGKESFVWINGPTSTLTANKIWPVVVDEYIEYKYGHKPQLPVQKTITFFDKNGNFDEATFKRVMSQPEEHFMKQTLGQGGKQVWPLGDLDAEELAQLQKEWEAKLRENPFSFVAQPKLELSKIELNWAGRVQPPRSFYYDFRTIGMISDGQSTIGRQIMVRLAPGKKINISLGGMLSMAVPGNVAAPGMRGALNKAGTKYIPIAQILTDEVYDRIIKDGKERAMIEAMFLYDIYTDPTELYQRFPELKYIVESNPQFTPDYFQARRSAYPTMFLSGPDYILNDQGYLSAIEHNTSSPGGYLRLWRRGSAQVTEGLKQWFSHMETLDRESDKLTVYFVEETELGGDWEKIRKEFREEFGVILASLSEKERFSVESDKLFFKDDDGKSKRVTSMMMHIEVDYMDSTVISDAQLGFMTDAEKRTHEIPGILKAVQAGNLNVVNEPGVDVSCSKVLLPFMADLRQYYLGTKEIIPTAKSWSFLNRDGSFNEGTLRRAISDPDNYLIKFGADTGGGDAVKVLKNMNGAQFDELVAKVRANPQFYILQRRFDHQVDLLGLHTEFRPFSMAQVNWDDSTKKGEVVGTLGEIYGRGANGNDMANIVPRAGQASGFNLPVVRQSELTSECARNAALFLNAM